MKKLLLALSLFVYVCSAHSAEQIFPINDAGGFGGGVDILSEDKLDTKYSPISGILNVNTDKYNEITKRLGTSLFNTIATTGTASIPVGYEYKKSDGNAYFVIQTSDCISLSASDGTFSTIIHSSLTSTNVCEFITANDCVYGVNGADIFRMDESTHIDFTVNNSTNYPTRCTFIKNWRNRNWLAGDSTYPNRVYYSYPFTPTGDTGAYENYPTDNFIDLGAKDGDKITGLQVWDKRLIVYFQRKIMEITESDTGSFVYVTRVQGVGCIYNTTISIHDGLPIFMSHRGFEQFDGAHTELISLPIDDTIKNLSQLHNVSVPVVINTTSDWGKGSGTYIDTTTYSGSVVPYFDYNHDISSQIITAQNAGYVTHFASCTISSYTTTTLALGDTNYWGAESYITMTTGSVNADSFIYFYKVAASSVSLTNPIGNIALGIDTPINTYGLGYKVTFNIPATLVLTYDDDDDDNIVDGTDYNANELVVLEWSATYQRWFTIGGVVNLYDKTVNIPIAHTTLSNNNDHFVPRTPPNATYISNVIDAGSTWQSWGSIAIDDTVPENSTISYYVKTATSAYNLTLSTFIAISNGSPITSTAGPFIQTASSFTRTSYTIVPQVNSITIDCNGSNDYAPQGISWEDRYYVSVSTDNTSAKNDTILVYQKNKDWTKYSFGADSFVNYYDKLYYGKSDNNGYIYRMEVPNVYSDNGTAYTSYWTTKKLSVHPVWKLNLHTAWVTFDSRYGDLDVSYNFDDYIGTWQTATIYNDTTYGIGLAEIPLSPSTYCRYFQLRIGNSTAENFRVKRIDIGYDDVPELFY